METFRDFFGRTVSVGDRVAYCAKANATSGWATPRLGTVHGRPIFLAPQEDEEAATSADQMNLSLTQWKA